MPPVFVLPDLFCTFAIVERYNVVITLISTIVFGAPLPTYYQFVIGWMSITNFIKNTIGGLPMRKHENESHTRLLGIINMWIPGLLGITELSLQISKIAALHKGQS